MAPPQACVTRRVRPTLCHSVAVATLVFGCGAQRSVELTFTQDEPHPADETDEQELPDDASAAMGATNEDANDGGRYEPVDPLACFAYVEALCVRLAECRNLPIVSEGCLGAASGCADLRNGTTTSDEELADCAAQYADFECDSMLRGRRLHCISPGSRPPGEPCETSLSCESLICDYDPSLGQYCAERVEEGAACPEGTACTFGEQCVAGKCEPVPPPDFTNGNLPLGAEGDECRDPHQCQQGLYCHFADATYLGNCRPYPTRGEECGNTRGYDWVVPRPAACDDASYCVDGICVDLPAEGEPCAESNFVDQRPCGPELYCDETDGSCKGWRQPGETCVGSSMLSGLTGLPLDPECDPELGARCSCEDDAVSCAVDDRRCRFRVYPGQDCDFDFASCTYGSVCTDGLCDYRE